MRPKYPSLEDRIIANSVLAEDSWFEGTPCWWWVGGTNGIYPTMSVRSSRKDKTGRRKVKKKLVHRFVRQVFLGEVYKRGHVARHLCPPHPNRTLCCNPAHIMPGTQRQNVRQLVAEGRHVSPGVNQYTKHLYKRK